MSAAQLMADLKAPPGPERVMSYHGDPAGLKEICDTDNHDILLNKHRRGADLVWQYAAL